jgi:hypothetical protein
MARISGLAECAKTVSKTNLEEASYINMHETKAFSVTEVHKVVPGDTQGLGLPPHHPRMSRLRVQLKASKIGRQVCWGQRIN